MAENKPNAVCVTCGRPYRLCRSCEKLKSAGIYTWRASCDTPECYGIFLTALAFRDGKITPEEAAERLKKYDLRSMLESDGSVKRILAPVMGVVSVSRE